MTEFGCGDRGRGGYDHGRNDYDRGHNYDCRNNYDNQNNDRGNGGERQIQQANRDDHHNDGNNTQNDCAMLPYQVGQPTSADFHAAQRRGGRAGGGFG